MILIRRLSIPSIPGALPDGRCSITTEISWGKNGGSGGCVEVVRLLFVGMAEERQLPDIFYTISDRIPFHSIIQEGRRNPVVLESFDDPPGKEKHEHELGLRASTTSNLTIFKKAS
ncbi:hypothetical protein AVEN_15121-1 [Araneus ventricosus]|uniref:Uncharacterized protein n=1 Tax=Araneus ventricosus TaxID=182803 RepID=A0A4Y2NKI1_ARAVE|nr:hypothetical protein AVEN_15121-1 [Araneus ventricosus]